MLTLLISRPGCRLAMSMSCLLQETWLSVLMNKLFNTYPKTHRVTSNSLMHGKRFFSNRLHHPGARKMKPVSLRTSHSAAMAQS
ncbi:hypothetical protein HZ326_16509 [Fusarium oxysporum f. sp. albedinis]|nr:hypothetical protein HZ326_16509 [Fusarium oxysporum f. sp. albedinis]